MFLCARRGWNTSNSILTLSITTGAYLIMGLVAMTYFNEKSQESFLGKKVDQEK